MVDTIRTLKLENNKDYWHFLKKTQENIKKIEITKIDDLPLTFKEKLNYAYGV